MTSLCLLVAVSPTEPRNAVHSLFEEPLPAVIPGRRLDQLSEIERAAELKSGASATPREPSGQYNTDAAIPCRAVGTGLTRTRLLLLYDAKTGR